MQVKGFTAGMNERFLLCDCINNKGAVITRQEGLGCVSYKDVFLSEMCVVTNMKQCAKASVQGVLQLKRQLESEGGFV